ncbi:MAG: PEP-CTERM sorting domain-containing protein [Acetobacteraceae bacterium]
MTSRIVFGLGAAALLLAGTGAAQAGYSVQLVTNPLDPANTMLLGINNSDQISGSTTSTGFTLTLPSSFAAQIAPVGSTSLQTVGINSAGSTDGFYVDASGTTNGYTAIGATFSTVNRPGTVFNQLLGINDSNTLVGYSSATDATGATGQDAYSRSAGGTYTDINGILPDNVNSQATGINNAGEVVGFYMPTSTTSLGFLDDGGSISTIDPFLSTFTQALGISNTGEIVGFYTDASSVQHGYTDIGGVFTSFDIAGAVSTTINGVNDKGQLVGFATIGDNVEGFVATPTPEPASLVLLASGILGLGLLRRRKGSA